MVGKPFESRPRSDSTDSTKTIRPTERPRSPTFEQSQRMAEESARLEKLDQRSRYLEAAKKDIPRALYDDQWKNYIQTLDALKLADPSSKDYRKLETILDFYDKRIESEKEYVAESKRLEEEVFDNLIASFPISRSNSGSSNNESGAEGEESKNKGSS